MSWTENLQDLLASRDPTTCNFADYDTCAPYVCCGWMDLHDDAGYGVSEASPEFVIEPLFWAPEAVFIVTDAAGRFVEVPRAPGFVRFNGMELHGLMPRDVADEVLKQQSTLGPLYQEFDRGLAFDRVPPKLVWRWIESDRIKRNKQKENT